MQLEKAVELDYHINLICLPPTNVKFDNKTCVATSWGKSRLTEPEEKFPSILKKSEMPVHEKAVCDEAYSNTNPPIKGLIPGVICAGGGERDTCEGHGGSPLACVGDNGAIFQIGIAAWGLGCKKPEAPIAYTEVSHYVDWINENTGF